MRHNLFLSLLIAFLLPWICSGCLLTRIATMPMRVGGAALTIIPGAGDAAHKVIDETADTVDTLPF